MRTIEHILHDVIADKSVDSSVVLKLVKPFLNNGVVDTLACCNRHDVLEQLKNHYRVGKRVREELKIKKNLKAGKNAWAAKVATYPSILKEIHEHLQKATKVGYYDVSYPSAYAEQCGLGKNYFAVSGDGLFMFMFEIVSLEERGSFKIAKRPINPVLNTSIEGRDSIAFREFGKWNVGDVLSGDQVIQGLKAVYQF